MAIQPRKKWYQDTAIIAAVVGGFFAIVAAIVSPWANRLFEPHGEIQQKAPEPPAPSAPNLAPSSAPPTPSVTVSSSSFSVADTPSVASSEPVKDDACPAYCQTVKLNQYQRFPFDQGRCMVKLQVNSGTVAISAAGSRSINELPQTTSPVTYPALGTRVEFVGFDVFNEIDFERCEIAKDDGTWSCASTADVLKKQ